MSIDWHGNEVNEKYRSMFYSYPWDEGSETHHGGWGVFGISDRGFDEALKSARDCLRQYKAEYVPNPAYPAPWERQE